MFKIRFLEENDYQELLSWWSFWRFPAPARETLPDNGLCGIVIYKEGINICAGFLYFTNSKICWLEFIVSNPEYRSKDRTEAIQILINELSEIAKEKGFKVMFTTLKNPNLIKHYEKCGYSMGSTGTCEMVKVL